MMPSRLKTPHLTLRPFNNDDAGAVFGYWQSDPGWERFNASVPSEFSAKDAEDFVADICTRNREERPSWALVHQGTVVGVVSLSFEQGYRIAVVGYGVHGSLRGRGLAAEAVRSVIDAAFGAYPQLRRIRAHTDAENESSIRVLKKLGFSQEGLLRSNQFVKGHFRDEAIFGMLREEWAA
jgi:RimJ/RimL family protein N-acetyltransferase